MSLKKIDTYLKKIKYEKRINEAVEIYKNTCLTSCNVLSERFLQQIVKQIMQDFYSEIAKENL